MEAPDSPPISSTITPTGKKAPIPVVVQSISATPQPVKPPSAPKPINYVVMPQSREEKISNALKSQTCCCCNLQIGLTIGFVIIILVYSPSFNWLSLLQLLCSVIGIIGVWSGSKDFLTVSTFALYFSIGCSIVQVCFSIYLWFKITRETSIQYSNIGVSALSITHSYSTFVLALAIFQFGCMLSQCGMICYINKAIAVLESVQKQTNNHVVLHTV